MKLPMLMLTYFFKPHCKHVFTDLIFMQFYDTVITSNHSHGNPLSPFSL